MQQVSWEILNFAALAAVCIICSPSGLLASISLSLTDLPDHSRLLSYVSQLPTEDYDDEEDEGGVQLGNVPSYSNDSDPDEPPKPVTSQPKSSAHKNPIGNGKGSVD